MLTIATNWQWSFSCQLSCFHNETFGPLYKRYLYENEALRFPTFYMKMNHFNLEFYMRGDDGKDFLSDQYNFRPCGPVFSTGLWIRRSVFTQHRSPSLGPVVRRFFGFLQREIGAFLLCYRTDKSSKTLLKLNQLPFKAL